MLSVETESLLVEVLTSFLFSSRLHLISPSTAVLPGRTTANYVNYPPPSINVGDEHVESYFSGLNPGGVYVVRYASLVLPCYVCGLHPQLVMTDSNYYRQMIEYDAPLAYNYGGIFGMGGLPGIAGMGLVPPPPFAMPVIAPVIRPRARKPKVLVPGIAPAPRKRATRKPQPAGNTGNATPVAKRIRKSKKTMVDEDL